MSIRQSFLINKNKDENWAHLSTYKWESCDFSHGRTSKVYKKECLNNEKNHLLMNKSQRKMLGYDLDSNKFKEHKDSGGFVVSFYCKYYNELVNSIKDDGGNIKKKKVNLILNFLEFAIETGINENYFTTNTIQNIFELINKLKEVFPDTKSPLISISKSKYPETYSFLNTMINVVNFDSFKDNDDLKTYYDRNDVILRYETLEAPKLVTKEELLKYLCLEE